MHKIQSAKINWQNDQHGCCVPVSCEFDDVYFSQAGGLAESEYVFLQGNHLPDRFCQVAAFQTFVIAETGFGTGLNFLATCKLWATTAKPNARLHFISTEKFPLTKSDLKKALSFCKDSDIQPWIDALLKNYPLLIHGCHRLHISEQITLDLWLGDATDSLQSIIGTQNHSTSKVDAWFLDGFAPSKNSEMWSQSLFECIAKLSHHATTLATFTAAGFVRRLLIHIGFDVKKIKGFGHKREMLTATFNQGEQPVHQRKHIAIIGAGISGVMSAFALSRRGHNVTLIDTHQPMSQASGNPRALFAPKLTLFCNASSHLPTVSFLYTFRQYHQLNQKALSKNLNQIFEQTGVVDFLLPTQKNAQKRREQIAPYPNSLIKPLDDKQILSDGYQTDFAAFSSMAGLVNPANLRQLVLQSPSIDFQQRQVQKIIDNEDGVTLFCEQQEIKAQLAIICSGYQSDLLDDDLFVCRKIRGQLSWASVNQSCRHPIKYDGYCANFIDDSRHYLLFGASFVRNCTQTDIRDTEHQFNLNKLRVALPSVADALPSITQMHGKAGIRAQTPDYHPLLGQINNKNIYTLYGMGSKGFSFAPFCAEVLADLIDGTILPIGNEMLAKLSPNRPRLQTALQD